jgi:hypothetical protein
MFRLRRQKKDNEQGIINLFKIVDYEAASAFNTADVIEYCMSKISCEINRVYWNFGTKEWKRYESFKNYIKEKGEVTVKLDVYSSEGPIIDFGNALLNLETIEENQTAAVEISVYMQNTNSETEFYLHFLKGILEIEDFDYGYVFYATKKAAHAQGVIANVYKGDNDTKQPFDIDNGYVRDIYPYNLLNMSQWAKIGGTLDNIGKAYDISDNLKFLVLTECEIVEVKKQSIFLSGKSTNRQKRIVRRKDIFAT